MKSACCKNEIVIQTDPKNCAYVIVSGARLKIEEFDEEDAETLLLPADEGKPEKHALSLCLYAVTISLLSLSLYRYIYSQCYCFLSSF